MLSQKNSVPVKISTRTHYMWWALFLLAYFVAIPLLGHLSAKFNTILSGLTNGINPLYASMLIAFIATLPLLLRGLLRLLAEFLIFLSIIYISYPAVTYGAFSVLVFFITCYFIFCILPTKVQNSISLEESMRWKMAKIVLILLVIVFAAQSAFDFYVSGIIRTLGLEQQASTTSFERKSTPQVVTKCGQLEFASRFAPTFRSAYYALCPANLFVTGKVTNDQPFPLITDEDLQKAVEQCRVSREDAAIDYPKVAVCVDHSPYLANPKAWENVRNDYISRHQIRGNSGNYYLANITQEELTLMLSKGQRLTQDQVQYLDKAFKLPAPGEYYFDKDNSPCGIPHTSGGSTWNETLRFVQTVCH